MSAYYYSKNHVFTNRKRGGDITLSAGPDEKLVIDGNFAISNIKYISTKEDFPEAISGIITLENNTTYVILKTVDLTGDRILCGTNNSLQGTFTEQSILKSTGLGTDYLITSTSSFNIHDLQVQNVNYVLNLDSSTSEQAVYFRAFNITGAATHIGTIKDYDLVMMSDCYFNGYGLSFSGTISTIGLQNCLFISVDGTAIISTATITTRIKIMDSSFYTTSPSVSLNVSGTISSQAYFLSNNVFQGTGTYLAGYTSTDNQSYFNHNTGITNSKSYGNWYTEEALELVKKLPFKVGTLLNYNGIKMSFVGEEEYGLVAEVVYPNTGGWNRSDRIVPKDYQSRYTNLYYYVSANEPLWEPESDKTTGFKEPVPEIDLKALLAFLSLIAAIA